MSARSFIALFFCIVCYASVFAGIPEVTSGRIDRHVDFPSKFVPSRTVDVWLPENYDVREAYSVVYMHDGAVLFDARGTWQNQEWDVDGVAGGLLDRKEIESCIVVGIWNSGAERHAEYCPEKPFRSLSKEKQKVLSNAGRHGGTDPLFKADVRSDAYLKFLVKELKPFIDKKYATLPGPGNTFIMGSSMGGLISIYAICEYPEVFGAAACMSTHWPMLFRNENNPFPKAMLAYLDTQLPDPKSHRIYFDHGTADLDALYGVHQVKVDALMRKKGFGPGSWSTRVFPGASHTEADWHQRLDIPFKFLLQR